jgi:hypothetical protein
VPRRTFRWHSQVRVSARTGQSIARRRTPTVRKRLASYLLHWRPRAPRASLIAQGPKISTCRVVPIVENEMMRPKTEFLPPQLPPDR